MSGATDEHWDAALDALVAAPEHHTLLWENERVRVIETHIPAGERTAVHTHRWPGVLRVVSWSHFIRYDDKGNILVESQKVEALKIRRSMCGARRCLRTRWKTWATKNCASSR